VDGNRVYERLDGSQDGSNAYSQGGVFKAVFFEFELAGVHETIDVGQLGEVGFHSFDNSAGLSVLIGEQGVFFQGFGVDVHVFILSDGLEGGTIGQEGLAFVDLNLDFRVELAVQASQQVLKSVVNR